MRRNTVRTSFIGLGLLLGACEATGDVERLEIEEGSVDEAEGIETAATELTASQDPMAQVPGFALGITRVGGDLQLDWANMGAGATYSVWHSTSAGFVTNNAGATQVASGLAGTTTTIAGAAGGANDFYRVRATSAGGASLGDSTIAGEVNTTVYPGINQLGISLFPMVPTSAGIDGGLADVSEVRSWDSTAQQWDTWLPWSGDPAIPVVHGESVWLGAIAAQVHGLLGQVPAVNESNASLVAGWNTVTMPLNSSGLLASDVLDQLPAAESVAFWSGADQGWWRLWQAGWGADFAIDPGMGFWIEMNAAGSWDPQICGDGVLDASEECDDGNWAAGDGCSSCEVDPAPSNCAPGFNTVSVAPSGTMMLCDDPTNATCEQNLDNSCAPGWGLCTRLQHINRNTGWNVAVGGGNVAVGEISCRGFGGAGHYSLGPYDGVTNLQNDPPLNCGYGSSRASCEAPYGCNETSVSAICCAPTPTCGNGVVDSVEEECDDGNQSETDDCLDTCAWRVPTAHGVNGIGC